MSKKDVLLIHCKRASYFLLILLIVCTLLCGCAYHRPEFDAVRITYEYQAGEQVGHMSIPVGQASIQTSDSAIMDELWELYSDLKINNGSIGLLFFPGAGPNPPMDFPRYCIEFLSRGEVVDQWGISSNFVVNGKRFGMGNHVIKGTKLDSPEFVGDPTIYNRITEIFESCDDETTE